MDRAVFEWSLRSKKILISEPQACVNTLSSLLVTVFCLIKLDTLYLDLYQLKYFHEQEVASSLIAMPRDVYVGEGGVPDCPCPMPPLEAS